MFRKLATTAIMLGLLCSTMPGTSLAQTFPTKPVRIILPFPAGGSTDLFVRLLSQKMQESTGQSWLVEYRPGGSTMVATVAVKTAPADGYTMLVGTNVMANNLLMYKKVDYRMEDFAPVSVFATGPLVLAVNKNVPAANINELIAYVKANPGKVNYATLGNGGSPHLLGKMLEQHAGLQMTDVPYKGAAQALTALVAGDVQIYFDLVPSSLAQQRAGNLRLFGVGAEERLKSVPEIPTLKEQGVPITSSSWFGFMVPAGTPKPIVSVLHRETAKAVASNEYQSRVISAGQVPVASASPEEFHTFIEREAAAWAKVIKPLNLQLD